MPVSVCASVCFNAWQEGPGNLQARHFFNLAAEIDDGDWLIRPIAEVWALSWLGKAVLNLVIYRWPCGFLISETHQSLINSLARDKCLSEVTPNGGFVLSEGISEATELHRWPLHVEALNSLAPTMIFPSRFM